MPFRQLLHGSSPADAPGSLQRARAYDLAEAVVMVGGRRRLFRRLVELAGVRPGDHVLDVGCGPGRLAAVAAESATPGGSVLGIDPSEPMVRRARSVAESACAFQLGSAQALDVEHRTIDVVLSSFVIHHIPEASRPAAYREMYRVLRPGGRLLVADFPPPRGRVSRRLVGFFSGALMRDHPIDRMVPMIRDAGFDVSAVGDIRPFTRYVTATRPDR